MGFQFYILRKLIEHEWNRKGFDHKHAYICSLSAHTIVYKGQLMPSQVHHLTTCSPLAGQLVGDVPAGKDSVGGQEEAHAPGWGCSVWQPADETWRGKL